MRQITPNQNQITFGVVRHVTADLPFARTTVYKNHFYFGVVVPQVGHVVFISNVFRIIKRTPERRFNNFKTWFHADQFYSLKYTKNMLNYVFYENMTEIGII
ncbi:hypothetical protein D3C85_1354480 [compost metagenome]